jgi:hypothetical protein
LRKRSNKKPLNVKNLLVKDTITHSLGSLLFLIYVGIISRKNTMLRGVVIITRDKVIVMNIKFSCFNVVISHLKAFMTMFPLYYGNMWYD